MRDGASSTVLPDEETGCVRPSFPPTLWVAFGLWTGVALAEVVAWRGGAPTTSRAACCLLGLAIAAVYRLCTHSGRRVLGSWTALVGIGLVCGLAIATSSWARFDWLVAACDHQGAQEWHVEVIEDPSASPFGWRAPARVIDGPAAGARVTLLLPVQTAEPILGRLLGVRGAFELSDGEWARPAHRRQEAGSLRVWRVRDAGCSASAAGRLSGMRQALLARVAEVPGDGGGLLAAMLLGYRVRVAGTQAEESFRAAGLSHVLAVSGTHLAVIALITGAAARALGAGRRKRSILVLCVAVAFTLLTGAHASTIRAALMTGAACLAGLTNRRGDSVGALAGAVVLILVASPPLAFSVGLALSVTAVAALVLFSPLAEEWVAAALPRSARAAAGAVAVAGVASVASAPLVASTFGTLSVIGPVANVLCVPLVTLALWIGCAGALLTAIVPGFAAVAFGCAGKVLDICAAIAGRLASIPGAVMSAQHIALPVAVGVAGVGVVVWAWWPRPRGVTARRVGLAAALIVILAFVGVPTPRGAQIVVVDVGQGDAILVRDGGNAVLVDTGEDPEVLRAALGRQGIKRLDAIVLTHAHADHIGGLSGVRGTCSVGRVLVPAASAEEFTSIAEEVASIGAGEMHPVEAGDTFRVGSFTAAVLWPAADEHPDDVNDGSVVIRLERGDFSALLTGDAEAGVYHELISRGQLTHVDVLKVPHHGSEAGVDAEILGILQPSASVVSVGEGNRFGHPTPATLDELARCGSRVWRTDHSGDVIVRARDSGFEIDTQRRGTAGEACERMPTVAHVPIPAGAHGLRTRRSQARVPDLWCRGTPARAGGDAFARQTDGGDAGGSRLQPRYIRRGAGRGIAGSRGCQHAAVHVGAPSRDPPLG